MSGYRYSGSILKRCLVKLFMLPCVALASPAPADTLDDWPTDSLRMVVPFPAKGPTDLVARIIAHQASIELGEQVVVENRPGAGGTLGVGEVARAAPDGYTLLLTTTSTHGTSPHLYGALPYDPKADFTPVAHLGSAGSILLVSRKLPVKSVQELIAYAKDRPGSLNYGTSGSGTIVHLITEAFANQAGITMSQMPYRGTGQARADLIAGSVQVLMDAIPTAMPFVQRGELRALAVTTAERSPLAPDLPTLDEAGLSGFEFTTWFGVYTPAGLPEARRARLHDVFLNVVQHPDVALRLRTLGITPAAPHTPEDFTRMVEADSERWKKVIEDSGITAQ